MWSPTLVGILGSQKHLSHLPHPQQLLERLSMLGRFGLGHKRTLDQLIAFTGIDVRNQVVVGDRCKELQVGQSAINQTRTPRRLEQLENNAKLTLVASLSPYYSIDFFP